MSIITSPARELGIPVKATFHTSLHPWRDTDGRPSLMLVMSQHVGGMIVCDVNLQTGHCLQWNVDIPGAEGGVSYRSPIDGTVYLATAGHLCRLRMGGDSIEDLGSIPQDEHGERSHICQLDQGADGIVWAGTYPKATLSSYDPATDELKHHGRMDDKDMYFYPRGGSDGTVAGLVRMCYPHVVALDRATGEKVPVGPTFDAEQGHDQITLIKASDGLLYIKSDQGNFRVRGTTAEPVESIPVEGNPHSGGWGGAAFGQDYGLTAKFLDKAVHRQLRVTFDDGETRDLELDWVGQGTSIYKLHLGPDGRLFGSSILPEHIFTCDIKPDVGANLTNHGVCSLSTGEAYTMGNLDGKLYICSYPNARLSIYDLDKPWHFTGTDEASNPRDMGRVDDVACRPLAMVAGPMGRVWVGSVPDYGMWGGTLTWYDPATGRKGTHRHLVQDCSVVALEWLPELNRMLVGTTVWAGSGAKPKARTCAFVLWDCERGVVDWTETFGLDPINGVYDFKVNDDGTVHAICFLDKQPFVNPDDDRPAKPELIHLDIANRKLLSHAPLPEAVGRPLEWALQRGPGGQIYGAAKHALYRIKPGTVEIEHVWDAQDGTIDVAGPIVDDTFFFASHHRLRCVTIG